MKKAKSVFLALASVLILLSAASCTAQSNEGNVSKTTGTSVPAVETDSSGGWFQSFGEYRYYTNGKEASIQSYSGTDTSIKLPDNCNGIPVVSVGWSAFAKNEKLEEVIVPDSIKVIGVAAFSECTSLKKVTLSNGVTKLDINCFTGCTSLSEIKITKSIEEIGISSFSKCESLVSITCDAENAFFTAIDGVLYSKDRAKLLIYPAGKPDEEYAVDDKTVAISDRACEGNTFLKTINLKDVIDIGSYAFKDCTNLLVINHRQNITVSGGAFENTFYEATVRTSGSTKSSVTDSTAVSTSSTTKAS